MISNNAVEDKHLADEWIARLKRWGIGPLAPIAVDVLKPFGLLGGQMLHLLSPVLTAFYPPAEIERFATLLESPAALDRVSDAFAAPERELRNDDGS
jgi:hypothetical protein